MSALVPKVTRELAKMRRTLRETFEMEDERCGNCDNCIHPLEEQIALPDPQRAAAYS